ncbi:beta-lactamase/transpeptidase-like protein, partial [Stipitochalara longipes BDJ]
MDTFETKLAEATSHPNPQILGAITTVIDRSGQSLYHHTSGHQSLSPDSPSISDDSTFVLGSAGKLITHIAALQLVERGILSLDEPVSKHLIELRSLKILTKSESGEFILTPSTKEITLRHLLSYSSGLSDEDHPLVQEWRDSRGEKGKVIHGEWESYHPEFLKSSPEEGTFKTPLLFEPGEGWCYGASIEWTGALISRVVGRPLGRYVEEEIFAKMGMGSSTYFPGERENIAERVLQMVERENGGLVQADGMLYGLVSSVPDLCRLFADLMGKSKVLGKEYVDLFFDGQLEETSKARECLRGDTENYAAPAGIPVGMNEAPVNHSLGALVVEEKLPLSGMPAGTLTWNGMPNFIWAVHREKGLGMVFATQLLPVDDEQTVSLAIEFFRRAWERFS